MPRARKRLRSSASSLVSSTSSRQAGNQEYQVRAVNVPRTTPSGVRPAASRTDRTQVPRSASSTQGRKHRPAYSSIHPPAHDALIDFTQALSCLGTGNKLDLGTEQI